MVLAVAYVVWDLERHADQLERQQQLLTQLVADLEEQRQAGVIAFCETEFDMRLIMADTLTIIANDPDDDPDDKERERMLADRVEARLQDGLPSGCDTYVDVSKLTIDTD